MTPDFQRGVEAAYLRAADEADRRAATHGDYDGARLRNFAMWARRQASSPTAPTLAADPSAVSDVDVERALSAYCDEVVRATDGLIGYEVPRPDGMRAALATVRAEVPPVGYEPPVLDPDPYERGVLYDAEVEYAMDRLWPGAQLDVRQRIREIVHEVRMADTAPVDLSALREAVEAYRAGGDIAPIVVAADELLEDATPAEPVAAFSPCPDHEDDPDLAAACVAVQAAGGKVEDDDEPQEPAEPARAGMTEAEWYRRKNEAARAEDDETSDEEGGRHGA